jgi:HK97 family phage portal protein
MNAITRAWSGAVARLKNAALRFAAPSGAWWGYSRGNTRLNYGAYVGDGSGNAIVVACVSWLCTAFQEPPLRVRRYRRNGDLEPQPKHPILALMRWPNPYYTGRDMMRAVLADLFLTGNGYLYKRRASADNVVQLWWIPSAMIEPRGGETMDAMLTHYDYTANGKVTPIPPRDIIHFPDRFDPRNPLKGLSRLAALLREIFTDEEAANYTSSILLNMGVPGLFLRPKTPEDMITPDQAQDLKADFIQKTTGDNRGMPVVAQIPMDIEVIGMSPEQMRLDDLRRIPEERVSAVFGTPAVLVGLGVGLEHSIYNNYSEAREAAFEEKLIPLGRDIAERLMLQLVPDFEADRGKIELDYDTREVRVLQEDQNNLASRQATLLAAGAILIDEARQAMGLAPLGEVMAGELPEGATGEAADIGKVLLIPGTHTPTLPADLAPVEAPPEPVPTGAGAQPLSLLAGTGGADADMTTEARRIGVAVRAALGMNGHGHQEG